MQPQRELPLASVSLALYGGVLLVQLVAFPCYAVVLCTVAYGAYALLAVFRNPLQSQRWVTSIAHAHFLVAYQSLYLLLFVYVCYQYGPDCTSASSSNGACAAGCWYDEETVLASIAKGTRSGIPMANGTRLSCTRSWDCFWVRYSEQLPVNAGLRVRIPRRQCNGLEAYVVQRTGGRAGVHPLSTVHAAPLPGFSVAGKTVAGVPGRWCSAHDGTLCAKGGHNMRLHWGDEARRCETQQKPGGADLFFPLPANISAVGARDGGFALIVPQHAAQGSVQLVRKGKKGGNHGVPSIFHLVHFSLLRSPGIDREHFRSKTWVLLGTVAAAVGLALAYARTAYIFHSLVAHRPSTALLYIILPLMVTFVLSGCWLAFVGVLLMALKLCRAYGVSRLSGRLSAAIGALCTGGQALFMLGALLSAQMGAHADPAGEMHGWLWSHSSSRNQTVAFAPAFVIVLYSCIAALCFGWFT